MKPHYPDSKAAPSWADTKAAFDQIANHLHHLTMEVERLKVEVKAARADGSTVGRYWTVKDIAKEYGVEPKTVRDKWTKRPGFPAPISAISAKTKAWKAEDVQAWAK